MVKLAGLFSTFFFANVSVESKAGLVDFKHFCDINLVVT